jgi:5-methylcytosine-specific restriction endonuclease McrA
MSDDESNSPCFVTCRCQHCDGGIEFDANNLEEDETRVVSCPHCGKETLLDAASSFSAEETADESAELEKMYSHRVYVHSIKELWEITRQFADKLNIEIDDGALELIARLSSGSPTDSLRLLQFVRDFAKKNPSDKKWITTQLTEKALKPLLEERAKLVAEEALRLASAAEFDKKSNSNRQAIPTNVRREVWRRDEGKCVKCASRKNLEYDHIIPVIEGGSNTARNIELLCESCNRAKSDSIQ